MWCILTGQLKVMQYASVLNNHRLKPEGLSNKHWKCSIPANAGWNQPSTSKLSLGSRSKWCSRYSRIISLVSSPAVTQKYPRAQKCLPQYRFLRWGNSWRIIWELRPLIRRIISEGEMLGGADTNMCTWSLLITPRRIWISNWVHVWRISSRIRRPTSPVSTWYRYFVTHTKWYSILYLVWEPCLYSMLASIYKLLAKSYPPGRRGFKPYETDELNHTSLKKRVGLPSSKNYPTIKSSSFIEIPVVATGNSEPCQVDIRRKDGSQMQIRLFHGNGTDLSALVRAFTG